MSVRRAMAVAALDVGGRWLGAGRISVARQRRRGEVLGVVLRAPRGVTRSRTVLGGVPVERLRPPAARGTVLHLHGGGFVIGSPRTHRAFAARLALASGAEVVVPDYRRAPEHPWPAALEDAAAALDALDARPVAVSGDSAGGGLALALAQRRVAEGGPLPVALGLLSPWCDLVPDVQGTRRASRVQPLVRASGLRAWARATLDEQPAEVASPARASLAGLPPMLVLGAALDPLADDGEELVRRARQADTQVEHHRAAGLWHAYPVLPGLAPEAEHAIHRLGAFARAALEGVER